MDFISYGKWPKIRGDILRRKGQNKKGKFEYSGSTHWVLVKCRTIHLVKLLYVVIKVFFSSHGTTGTCLNKFPLHLRCDPKASKVLGSFLWFLMARGEDLEKLRVLFVGEGWLTVRETADTWVPCKVLQFCLLQLQFKVFSELWLNQNCENYEKTPKCRLQFVFGLVWFVFFNLRTWCW